MNLRADSGAILMMLIPLPLHKDRIPPSLIICVSPFTIHMLLLWEPCTWDRETSWLLHGVPGMTSMITSLLRFSSKVFAFCLIEISGLTTGTKVTFCKSRWKELVKVWPLANAGERQISMLPTSNQRWTCETVAYRTNQSAGQRVCLTSRIVIGCLDNTVKISSLEHLWTDSVLV